MRYCPHQGRRAGAAWAWWCLLAVVNRAAQGATGLPIWSVMGQEGASVYKGPSVLGPGHLRKAVVEDHAQGQRLP